MEPARQAAVVRREAVELCARQILEVVPRAMRLLREAMRRAAGAGLSRPQSRALAPAERRRVMLGLTARGSTLLERARAHARGRVVERLEALGGAELSA